MCGQCGCDVTTEPRDRGQTPTSPRHIDLHRNLLQRNAQQALHNRIQFQRYGLLAVNLLSAPGSGKTAFLEQLASLGINTALQPEDCAEGFHPVNDLCVFLAATLGDSVFVVELINKSHCI